MLDRAGHKLLPDQYIADHVRKNTSPDQYIGDRVGENISLDRNIADRMWTTPNKVWGPA